MDAAKTMTERKRQRRENRDMDGVKRSGPSIARRSRRYYPEGMNTVTCKLPRKLDLELRRVARRRGVGKSKVIRDALEAHLPEQNKLAGLTAYDLMKDGLGVVDSGVADLGRNPKHMEGFGRD